ncbi:MAG: globin [Arcobacter sp.]|uniref:globin domain-containing protein n=1 Tax=uncultured Arcobacter sp. TaxID=165434 RepID=UPI000CC2691B|nr:globin [uncultured Arcobacter sp.]PLY09030.1 MAG: globin [Arcobacter sp.]
MNYTITEGQFGQRPNVDLPNPKVLESLGEEGMREMINNHYELLVETQIKGLFPPTKEGLDAAKRHAADFFIQICGGPRYFDKSRGAPRMVARHSPFRIDSKARIIWLENFAKAIEETNLDEELKKSFWNYIDIFSIWMVNSSDTPQGVFKV